MLLETLTAAAHELQGFPDYFTFVGIGAKNATSWVRNNSLTSRYQQLGNAVCPMVAEALGRCLAQAALGEAPVGGFVVTTPNLEFDRVRPPAFLFNNMAVAALAALAHLLYAIRHL